MSWWLLDEFYIFQGVAMHCQTRYHAMNRANAEMEGEEEEEEDMGES